MAPDVRLVNALLGLVAVVLGAAPCTDNPIPVPCSQAKRALECVRVELPKCKADRLEVEGRLRAELVKQQKATAAQLERADTCSSLLDRCTRLPPRRTLPAPSWQRWLAVGLGVAGAALGAAGVYLARDDVAAAIPLGTIGVGALVGALVALVDP